MKGMVTTHFPISEKWATLSPKLLHSSVPRYNVISSYVNAYFHLDYLLWVKLRNVRISKFT